MAISTQAAVKAKRQALSLVKTLAVSSSVEQAISTLFQELSQKFGNVDLQVVPFDLQTSAASDAVIADAACKLYAIVTKKANATSAWLKGSDSASASSSTAGEWTKKLGVAGSECALFPAGFAQANGWTLGADTTAAGSTNSTAGDGPKGFVILGAA